MPMQRDGRRRRVGLSICAAAAAAVAGARVAGAATATWSGNGSGSWADPADWAGGVVPGGASATTTGSTDVALFNGAGGGAQAAVTVDVNRSIGGVTFDTAAAAGYTFGGGTLLLGGAVQMTSTVTRGQTFNDALLLPYGSGASATLANNASSAAATLAVNGAVSPVVPAGSSLVQPTTTLYLTGTNAGDNRLAGPVDDATVAYPTYTGLAGYTAIVKAGTGTWDLAGTQTLRTAAAYPVDVTAGTLVVSGSFNGPTGLLTYATLQVTGTIVAGPVLVAPGGTVTFAGNGHLASATASPLSVQGSATVDNTAAAVSDRLDGTPVYLNGGTLALLGSAAGGPAVADAVGTLSTPTGANAFTLTPSPSAATTVACANLSSGVGAAGGTLLLTGTHLGGAPAAGVTDLLVAAAATTAGTAPVGGGGGPGTTTASVLPFAVGRDLARAGNAQYGFVAGVGAANGVRVLDPATEYASAIADGNTTSQAAQDVSLTAAATVTAGATVNALRLDAGGGVGGTGTLAVASGAVLALPGNGGLSTRALAFGAQPGVVTTVGDLTLTGTVTGSAGLVKAGAGTLTLGPGTTLGYAGATVLNQGTLKVTATGQTQLGGTLSLLGGTLDLDGTTQFVGTLAGLGSGANGRSAVVNSSATAAAVYVTGASGTTGPSGRTFTGTLGGPGGNDLSVDVDVGTGNTLGLGGANTFANGLTVASGNLNLDFTLGTGPANNVLPAATYLALGDQLTMSVGNAASTQAVAATTVLAGGAVVREVLYGSGSAQLNVGGLGRSAGGTLEFVTPAAAGSGFQTASANVNGILGGWAVVNGTAWAARSATSAAVVAYAAYTANAWSAGANVTATASGAVADGATANTLQFATPAAVTVTLAGTATLAAGGVLVSPAVGANPSRLAGGTLAPGAGNELILNQWNPSATLQVDAVLANAGSANAGSANAGSAAAAVTVSGPGAVTLTAANTYTGPTHVSGGQLSVSSDANLGLPSAAGPVDLDRGTLSATASFALAADATGTGRRAVNLGPTGGTVAVAAGQTLTVPGVVTFGGYGNSTLTVPGPGTLNLTGGFSAQGKFNISGGTLQLDGAYDPSHGMIAIDNATGGQLAFGPGVGTYYVGGFTAGNIPLVDTAGQPVSVHLSAPQAVAGGFSGPGSLSTDGNGGGGTVTLSGTDTYAGTTTVQNGGLTFATTASVPPPTAGAIVNNGTVTFAATAAGPAVGNLYGNVGTTVVHAGVAVTLPQVAQQAVVVNGSLQLAGAGLTSSAYYLSGTGSLTVGGTDAAHADVLELYGTSNASTVGTLAINAGSQLDVGSALLDVTASDLATATALAARGYAGGTWAGPGLVSSVAAGDPLHLTGLGVIANRSPTGSVIYATFGGLPAAATDVLVRRTYYGDANLDGVVDAADYLAVDNGYVNHLSGWANGDFNYDGVVDGSDYTLMDDAFDQEAPAGLGRPAAVLASPAAELAGPAAAVPEPAAALAVVVATGGLLGRRRGA